MKKIKWLGLLIFMLLAACGSVPTDGLTSFMGQPAPAQVASVQELPAGLVAVTTKSCIGEVNLQTNLVRLSFELVGDTAVFEPNNEPLFLFGGGTPLLAHVPANANGTFRFRCEGEGVITAVPLRANGEIVGWAAGLTAPQLTVDLPSGNSKTVDDVSLDGFLAPTMADLSKTVSALYGAQFIGETEKNLIFEASYTTQRALYRNYPEPAFMRQLTLSGGMSEVNAARMGQLYAGDVANKQTVLLDVITSADEAYLKAVVGATISSLYMAGLDTEQIAQLFAQETNGRITVQFGGVGNGPWTVAVINQGNGSATVHASSESGSDNGDGGSSGGATGGDTGGSTGGEQGGGEGGGESGGEPGGETGGETGGDQGGDMPGGRTVGEFLIDLFWNVLGGAAGGAAAGTFLPGVGTLSGALGGALAGLAKTIGGGFWDPGPNDPNNPCSSPFLLC